jgi:putative ABC transport system permease protein
VNGATIPEIIMLLIRGFLIWVLVSFILAIPVAYFAIDRYLSNFAFKTELSWWIFAAGGFIAIIVAFITVSLQALRAAIKNPVDALRYE